LRAMRDEPISLLNLGLLKQNMSLIPANYILDDEEVMRSEVAEFKASGGSAMVDMSSVGLRLDLPGVKRISQQTGVHVVTTTGFYVGDSWPDSFRNMTVDQLAEHMVKEIKEGIEGSEVRAGHIKMGVDDLGEQEERSPRAAAHAAAMTGLSVTGIPAS